MPTLIRLVLVVLVLAGLAYGAMFALTIFVTPPEKEITVRIPARDLMPTPERDPLVLREIDTTRTVEAPQPEAEPSPVEPSAAPAPENADDGDIVTLSPGIE